ncbi:MAG TPA: c-type cytochrome [Acidimicrobiales bacterium]|nr:c-type cytochrome [Acidimicrobiales bacterium]
MSRSGGRPPKVPASLRPGETDDVLEGRRLNKIMMLGFLVVVFFALFLPVYWFFEPQRMNAKEARFHEQSVERGSKYYALHQDAVTGAENFEAIECARCHGLNATGGNNEFLNPSTGQKTLVQVPPLNTVYAKFEANKESFGFPVVKDARQFVMETIERGRPGTDMPTWGSEYGGPLTEQQIEDIVNWLETIQQPLPTTLSGDGKSLFDQVCATCHGPGGSGGVGPAFVKGAVVERFPNRDDHIAFVKAGSVAGQQYGVGGLGTGHMPPKGGYTALTDQQIAQIVDYERGL